MDTPIDPSHDPSLDPSLAANLEAVRQRIAEAAHRVGRSAADIRLLPVTKFVPAQRLRALAELGCREMGENRVQEVDSKATELADLGIDWVLIGHLQTNKARTVARICTEIQSLDSLRLAQALDRHLQECGRTMTALIEVNTSGEDAKSGFEPAALPDALAQIRALPNLRVRGLMTMARLSDDPEVPRASFRMLRELRDSLQSPNDLPELSMGMSGDFEVAIEEGATTVRVGSAIFGARS